MDLMKSRNVENAMGRFEAKTSVKGQATIPIEVRKALGLAPGGSVQFVVGEDGKVSVIAKKSGLRHLKGIFRRPSEPIDVEGAIAETVERRTSLDRKEEDP
jgi:AbrB family looped-hinge helix DNA binding protein